MKFAYRRSHTIINFAIKILPFINRPTTRSGCCMIHGMRTFPSSHCCLYHIITYLLSRGVNPFTHGSHFPNVPLLSHTRKGYVIGVHLTFRLFEANP